MTDVIIIAHLEFFSILFKYITAFDNRYCSQLWVVSTWKCDLLVYLLCNGPVSVHGLGITVLDLYDL